MTCVTLFTHRSHLYHHQNIHLPVKRRNHNPEKNRATINNISATTGFHRIHRHVYTVIKKEVYFTPYYSASQRDFERLFFIPTISASGEWLIEQKQARSQSRKCEVIRETVNRRKFERVLTTAELLKCVDLAEHRRRSPVNTSRREVQSGQHTEKNRSSPHSTQLIDGDKGERAAIRGRAISQSNEYRQPEVNSNARSERVW